MSRTSYVLNKQNNTYKLVKKNNEARGFMGSVPTLNVDVDIWEVMGSCCNGYINARKTL